MSNLWSMVNYRTPARFLLNSYIREYDLSKANISSLLYTGHISLEEYNRFLNMDKQSREVSIGLMIRNDPSIYKHIQEGIIEAKRRLFTSNNLQDYDIISIHNDAVFVSGDLLSNISFPPFEFKIKNLYTAFLQLQDLEIYYGDDIDVSTELIQTNIDIKGISDSNILLHQNGMLDIICDACYKLQREDIKSTMSWINDIYRQFIERKLPFNYYRNFDAFSAFTINTMTMSVSLPVIDDTMVRSVVIDRNLSILRDLISIISTVYHQSIR